MCQQLQHPVQQQQQQQKRCRPAIRLSLFFIVAIIVTQLPSSISGQQSTDAGGGQCEPQFLDQCIKMADPLLKEAKHVFPANSDDVDHVCRVVYPQTWSDFIACIKSFNSNCLTNGQRLEFNRAVGDSINSVHKMCTNDDYRSAYLGKAECILEKALGEETCKTHYDKLIGLIQEPTSSQDLCCAHESFKLCIVEESKECPCEKCGTDDNTAETASHFAKMIMENSLGFLLKQCSSQVSPKPCVGGYTVKRPRFEPEEVAPEANRGSTYFPTGDNGSSNRRPATTSDDLTTTTTSSGDARHPKEVTTDEDDFSIQDLQDNSFFGAGSEDSELTTSLSPSHPPPAQTTTRIPWLPDTDIKDFDEFLRNALQQGGFSSQGLRSAASNRSRWINGGLIAMASFLILMVV